MYSGVLDWHLYAVRWRTTGLGLLLELSLDFLLSLLAFSGEPGLRCVHGRSTQHSQQQPGTVHRRHTCSSELLPACRAALRVSQAAGNPGFWT